jgi:adenosylcobinamide-GDP ribazoletransferase
VKMVRQILLAVSFLTRIPIYRLDLSKTDFARATVYFPLIGTFIGCLGAGVFWLAHLWFSNSISIALTLTFLMLLTGALHEDGLADAFDAFGSKHKKEEILETMRDSRIGTYAALALIMAVLLKFLALNQMAPHTIILSLVLAHTISRWAMLPTLALLPYPRKSAAISKRFVEAVANMPKWHLLVSVAFTAGVSFLLSGIKGVVLAIMATVVGLLFTWYFWKKIQGATGDCYGTIQQCTEVILYLAILKLL